MGVELDGYFTVLAGYNDAFAGRALTAVADQHVAGEDVMAGKCGGLNIHDKSPAGRDGKDLRQIHLC